MTNRQSKQLQPLREQLQPVPVVQRFRCVGHRHHHAKSVALTRGMMVP
jgi:hypothetical protein